MTSEFEKDRGLAVDEQNRLAEGFLSEVLRMLHYNEDSYEIDDKKVTEKSGRRYTLTVKRELKKDYINLHSSGIQQDLNIEEISIVVNYAEDRNKVEGSYLGYTVTHRFPEWPTENFTNDSQAVDGITSFISAFKETL